MLRYRIGRVGPDRDQPPCLRFIGKICEAGELWEQISFVLIILALVGSALYVVGLRLRN
jgi:hypothetical protein